MAIPPSLAATAAPSTPGGPPFIRPPTFRKPAPDPFVGWFRGGGVQLHLRTSYPGYTGELITNGETIPIRASHRGPNLQGSMLRPRSPRFKGVLNGLHLSLWVAGRRFELQRFDKAADAAVQAQAARRRAVGPAPKTARAAKRQLLRGRFSQVAGNARGADTVLYFRGRGVVERVKKISVNTGKFQNVIVAEQLRGTYRAKAGGVALRLNYDVKRRRRISRRMRLVFRDGGTLVDPKTGAIYQLQ